MVKRIPWHTLVFFIYPILYLYSANAEYVEINEILIPISVSIGLAAIFVSLFKLVFKSWIKAGLSASCIALIIFNYGLYQDAFIDVFIPFYPKNIWLDHNFYKWISLTLFLLIAWRLWKTKSELIKLNALVNLISIALLLMASITIVQFQIKRFSFDANNGNGEIKTAVGIDPNRPNIYYLIMDAYTRNDILKSYFNYDNSDFTNFLKKEGFYVAEQSISNYGHTVLSIPSALNMCYMDSMVNLLGAQNTDRWPMSNYLNNSKVLRKLRTHKYKTKSYDAAMFPVAYLTSADEFYQTPGTQLSLFHNQLINITILRAFNRRRSINFISPEALHRRKIRNAFTKMEETTTLTEPQYIHGHILAPHQPFLFDKDGNDRDMKSDYNIWNPLDSTSDNSWYKEGYVEQLQYINKRLKTLITKILHESIRPSIIIIQGDHGTASELRNHKGFEGNDFKERFSILNAYYFPDKDYRRLYNEISPVNSFKVIMNKYFNGKFKMEPDKAFYSDWNQPYNFTEVTGLVR